MPTPKGGKAWNSGTSQGWTDKRGYRWLYVTEGGKRRARRGHRVVMERHLGRRLEPWELVHHKDGNTANNDLSNLEVMEFGAHTTEHSTGTKRAYETRRSMEAFALLREELRHVRSVNADLLEALQNMTAVCHICSVHQNREALIKAYAAISKALGQEHSTGEKEG